MSLGHQGLDVRKASLLRLAAAWSSRSAAVSGATSGWKKPRRPAFSPSILRKTSPNTAIFEGTSPKSYQFSTPTQALAPKAFKVQPLELKKEAGS